MRDDRAQPRRAYPFSVASDTRQHGAPHRAAFCYAAIAVTTALTAWLPERSQAPLGWFYVVAGAGVVVLLVASTTRRSSGDR